jgi:hypothetical protein
MRHLTEIGRDRLIQCAMSIFFSGDLFNKNLGLKNEILSLKTEIVRIKADKFTFAS